MKQKSIVIAVIVLVSWMSAARGQVPDPPEMVRLRGSYEAAMARTTRPLMETYIAELTKVKDSYTKAGKLDEAVRVDSEIKVMKERLAALGNPSVSRSGSGSLSPAKVARVTIPANDPNGYQVGAVKRGDTITLEYQEGLWKDHGGIATANPDEDDAGEENRLVLARGAVDGIPGEQIQIVSAGTRKKPFVYVFQTSRDDVVLRISANSDRKQNPGSVIYSMTLKRTGG
ncbi:MAG: hypothetical protein V4662_22860 [Verrucomicrobiota bacterium]